MPNIRIKRQHKLGKTECRQRVEQIAYGLQEKLNASWAWEGDSLKFDSMGASGAVDVGDDSVEFNIKLSMLLAPLKGFIENEINQKSDEELG